jgi:hypothetical protein
MDFNRRPFWSGTWEWLKRRRPMGRDIAPGTGNITLTGYAPTIAQSDQLPPGATVEERLAALAAKVDKEIKDLHDALRAVNEQSAERIKEEARARASDSMQLREQLSDAVAGNGRPLTFGLAWLAAGVTVSTLPKEIADCVHGKCAEVFCSLWNG